MAENKPGELHTPQHRLEMEPKAEREPSQDRADSNELLDQLDGRNDDQTAYIGTEDVESLEGVTMTDVYQGETDPNQELVEAGEEQFDLLVEQELRRGETDDAMEAVEEGLTYVPPIDPPTTTNLESREAVGVANGFALSADEIDSPDELQRDDLDRFFDRDDDMTAMVRNALRSDSATTHLADRLSIATINGRVIVRGLVDDLDDSDNLVAVISELPGVQAVSDQTEVRGM
jgi:hypothetical protein